MRIPEGEKGEETLDLIMPKNFPKLMTFTQPQIQEAHSILSRVRNKQTNNTPKHIIFNLRKIKYKEKILEKATRKKQQQQQPTSPIEERGQE